MGDLEPGTDRTAGGDGVVSRAQAFDGLASQHISAAWRSMATPKGCCKGLSGVYSAGWQPRRTKLPHAACWRYARSIVLDGAWSRSQIRSKLDAWKCSREKFDLARLERTSCNGRVVCEERDLLIEEAPQAYNNPVRVLEQFERSGVASCMASCGPIATFKKARREVRS